MPTITLVLLKTSLVQGGLLPIPSIGWSVKNAFRLQHCSSLRVLPVSYHGKVRQNQTQGRLFGDLVLPQRRNPIMRMLLRVSIPVEAGNAAAKAGTLGTTVERILGDLKPEAAYFFVDDAGQRSGSIVFEMKDTSQIPAIAEPWFLAFNAKISIRPIMNPQDLAGAGPSIAKAAQDYGR